MQRSPFSDQYKVRPGKFEQAQGGGGFIPPSAPAGPNKLVISAAVLAKLAALAFGTSPWLRHEAAGIFNDGMRGLRRANPFGAPSDPSQR